ncbi:uncharacterized protein V6R79_000157 [Siganus canaliculatus]
MNGNGGSKNKPAHESAVNLVGCSGDLERMRQKNPPVQPLETTAQKSPHVTSDQQDPNWRNLVVKKEESPLNEQPHSVKIMNLSPSHNFLPKNMLACKTLASNWSLENRQYLKQTQASEQPPQIRVSDQLFSTSYAPSLLPQRQKTSNVPGVMSGEGAVNHPPPEGYLQPAEPVSGSSQGQAQNSSSVSGLTYTDKSAAPTESLLENVANKGVIIIESSSEDEDELHHLEMELSDSDPMEECYRIFMEENEDKGNVDQFDVSVGAADTEKPELDVKPQTLTGKKRVAHEAKHAEQPAAKSRPQPQVLVPLREPAVSGFASQPSITSKIQHVQQRASVLSASVKAGQAFVSSTCQRRPEPPSAPLPSNQTPENLQHAPVQNAYMNYIPLGSAVIEVGNNLHLILPEGTFPLPVTTDPNPVPSVLTPVSQVQMSTFTVKQGHHPVITPVQRYRTTPPAFSPQPLRKPPLSTCLVPTRLAPSASTATQAAVPTSVKLVPTKRKVKQQNDAPRDKVPHDIRQRYVNMFTEEFLKTTPNVNDAFQKALAEEKTVYNRSINKLKYLSVAVNALKRLKNQSVVAVKDENEINRQKLKGNISLNLKSFKGNDDKALYESLKDYILTEERLIESNYPVQHPERPGSAVLFADNKKTNTDPLKRICCRCGATYSVTQTGKHTRKEECNYHYGKAVKNKVPGGVETRYSCCEGVMGAPGCQVYKLHVHDALSLEGFVSTDLRRPSDKSCPGVYSLDCEMCYTIHGLELCRVTLVNSSLQVIYDTFVRPENEVIDYNTRFSGISEEDLKGNHTTLKEVQETMLSFINADTILIGHGLENGLCALKLLHGTVVDTSVVFPHRLGPPNKLTLNKLTAEYLRRILQESVCGHDTAEDAAACMELMLWKTKEDGKMRK